MNTLNVLKHDALSPQALRLERQRLESALEGHEAGSEPLKVSLSPSLLGLLLGALEGLEKGQDIALIALEAEVSPQDAAVLLGASRPYVMDLLKLGTLSSRRVGSHHRIPLEQILNFHREQDVLEEEIGAMTRAGQGWGLGHG